MNTVNDKMLANAALLFVLSLVLVILVQWVLAPSYNLTNEAVLEQTAHENILIKPQQLKSMQADQSLKTFTLLDLSGKLKNKDTFGSVLTVPFADLLDSDQLKVIKKAEQLLVVGDKESEAVMAVQLLMAKGVTNITALANGVAFTDQLLEQELQAEFYDAHAEKARFDYGRFLKATGNGQQKAAKQAEVPGAVKVVAAAGGC
ncbi:MAG: hypothetical protein PWQ54_1517 [Bacteroidales bacterium]|nr:hypothetical protein [Bacteroidales bacterium]